MDALDRLFRRLVQNVRSKYPDYLAHPFEAAEIYQTIVPYRLNRRDLAIDSNEDYEAALLELFSGARGYLVVDDSMREALSRELASVNPDPSAFRAFATALVSISGDAVRALGAGPSAEPSRRAAVPSSSPPGPMAPVASTSGRAPAAKRPAAISRPSAAVLSPNPSQAPATVPPAQRSITAAAAGGSCRYCSGGLPEGRRITFCPHCGQNLTIQHCPACGTELELGWKFCTTCGRGVGS